MQVALLGDTMLGRQVGSALAQTGGPLWSEGVRATVRAADLALANLECCISERGERWPDPSKPFFFRAPPAAAEALADLGVDVVTLANNHALDYGPAALQDTLAHLDGVGIVHVGAGLDRTAARAPAILERAGRRLGVIGFSDHPADFAADQRRPGIAYADLFAGLPAWVPATIERCAADAVLVTPHWGPNMVAEPVAHVRAVARELALAGTTLVAGHSAHCFHGVAWLGGTCVCYDLGDFVDDYVVHPERRNDLGLLWVADLDLDGAGVRRLEAVPLKLEHCFTRLAEGDEAATIARRLERACAAFGTACEPVDGRLRIEAAAV